MKIHLVLSLVVLTIPVGSNAEKLAAITDTNPQQLITFDGANPAVVTSEVQITGNMGRLVTLDLWPGTNLLYALG